MNDRIPPEVTEARLRITEEELRAGEDLSSLLTQDEIAAMRQRLTTPVLVARLNEAVEAQRAESARRYGTEPPIAVDSHCARCLRPIPPDGHSDESDWLALDSDALLVVCPDCITPEEQQAMDEADMALIDEVDPGWDAELDS